MMWNINTIGNRLSQPVCVRTINMYVEVEMQYDTFLYLDDHQFRLSTVKASTKVPDCIWDAI